MKCPHCAKESKAKVLESRRVNGEVWRNRLCTKCLRQFVSHETTSADMKFPWADVKRARPTPERAAPAPTDLKWDAPLRLW